jgi:hypothetical protein
MLLNAVSSPPIVMSSVTPNCSSVVTTRSSALMSRVGLAREMPRWLPPRKWMRDTVSIVSGRTRLTSPFMSHSKPSSTPSTSTPESRARMVAAAMTLLIPGAGPPPTRMASFWRDDMSGTPWRGRSRDARRQGTMDLMSTANRAG